MIGYLCVLLNSRCIYNVVNVVVQVCLSVGGRGVVISHVTCWRWRFFNHLVLHTQTGCGSSARVVSLASPPVGGIYCGLCGGI